MGFIIGLLTLFMVLDCVVLILLVLLQLPKKDAGAGLAFGGAATDALFGAGSGTVLTKITKYTAVIFFGLSLFLSVLQSKHYHGATSKFQQRLEQGAPASPGPIPPVAPPGAKPSAALPPASTPLKSAPAVEDTNLPAAPPKPAAPAASVPAPAAPAAPANAGAPK
jgi:preprotein translocase subunit SecG